MNRGIIIKSIYETGLLTLLCGTGVLIFEIFLVYVITTYQELLTGELMQIEYIRNMMESLVGTELPPGVGPSAFGTIVWVHPLILIITWTHAIALLTRLPAGEVDRGTIDLLLSLPLSRRSLYVSETFVWVVSGAFLMAMLLLGNVLGHQLAPSEDPPGLIRSAGVALNFYALYLAVGALALFISTMSDRRGRAIGGTFAVVASGFLWNFIGPYWEPADRFSFLSPLSYYRPVSILQDGIFPTTDLAILLAVALFFWTAGAATFIRRDICTV